MIRRTFDDLAQDLRQRRVAGDPPPVLLLGAGASVDAGVGAMQDLFRFVGRNGFKEFCEYVEPLTAAERYRLLSRFLQSTRPAEATPGYRALAALCAEAYFDVVLTTNLDPLLDDALSAARLWRKDYLLLVNGIVRPEWLRTLLGAPSPRVKVVKLHGDLFHRRMAWTPEEMEALVEEVEESLDRALHGRDLLVVGHSLRDARIRALVERSEGTVWYVTPFQPPDFLEADPRARALAGPDGAFETLFTRLAGALGVEAGEAAAPARTALDAAPEGGGAARTVDDLMGSVVAFEPARGPYRGQKVFSGFVLAGPRVVVTDRYSASMHGLEKLEMVAQDGRRFPARPSREVASHPFGPMVLEAPEELRVPGLRLEPSPVEAGLGVRVGVAAGTRTGVSSGTVTDGVETSLRVDPVGEVKHLVALDCVVAPGSSGAPVVDTALAVRGFVVAGRGDHPPSYMYPASRWAEGLARGSAG